MIFCRGSSPHTRGTQHALSVGSRPSWDHPRIRGEHRWARRTRPERLGIIPAYAGNTVNGEEAHRIGEGSSPHTRGTPPRFPTSTVFRRDHPRIRGEHGQIHTSGDGGVGIIPAYAGNTIRKAMRVPPRRGSSPHKRGTLRRVPVEYAKRRWIIPAYAGNTLVMRRAASAPTGSSPHTRGTPLGPGVMPRVVMDHPRIRGEHHADRHPRAGLHGIIPAYAGNTTMIGSSPPMVTGSSPHTRGTRPA